MCSTSPSRTRTRISPSSARARAVRRHSFAGMMPTKANPRGPNQNNGIDMPVPFPAITVLGCERRSSLYS